MTIVGGLVEDVAEALGLKTQMAKLALAQAFENLKMLDRKQQDYGSGNISEFGEVGVMVRAMDKTKRLANLWRTGKMAAGAANESVADNWDDLSNYGIIGKMCHTGVWK